MKAAFSEMTVLIDEPLSNYTFTKTGGPADILVFPKTSAQTKAVVDYCREQAIPWFVLGNASNLIVKDGGMRGVVLMLTEMKTIQIEGETIRAEAGARLIDTSRQAGEAQLTGFEFACGIPGSVGGAVYMNAGAYGGEIKDICISTEILYPDGQICEVSAEELAFSYRHSDLQETGGILLSATFRLKKGRKDLIAAQMEELTQLRESKQPLEYPSCGSVFKRPEGHFTGKLIQDAGLQGMQIGGAQISKKHAGFIVNIDGATATDYLELIKHIQRVIKEQFDVVLETEVRIIGEE